MSKTDYEFEQIQILVEELSDTIKTVFYVYAEGYDDWLIHYEKFAGVVNSLVVSDADLLKKAFRYLEIEAFSQMVRMDLQSFKSGGVNIHKWPKEYYKRISR